MLRAQKKISKRELKRDPLIDSYTRATNFYDEHRRTIGFAIVAVVVLVVAGFIYMNNQKESDERAATALGSIYGSFDAGQYRIAIDGVPERGLQGLRSIVENHGSTTSGNIARFLLASALYKLGEYEEALKEFDRYSPANDFFAASRFSGMAACHEALGRHAKAGELYERAARYKGDINAAENLNHAARNYAQAGNKGKALELYKTLKKDHPASTYAREVDRHITELSI
jgi:tetratricopeptide (TPR) repeat protein